MVRLFLFAFVLLLAACQAGPISGAAVGALAALDQMLAAGTITPEQYSALRGSLGGFSMAELLGTAGGTLLAGGVAAVKARNSAVRKVMDLRGPTESQRRAAAKPTSPGPAA